MIFQIFICAVLCAFGAALLLLRREQKAAVEQRASLALEIAKLKEQIEELDPQAGVDADALEKAFNEGLQRIMDYSLTKAMGGGMNG